MSMSCNEIAALAVEWDEMKAARPESQPRRGEILLTLRTGTPERQAYQHALMLSYLNDGYNKNIFMRVLQSEADRSEA
jgi:hypothetical protein